MIRKSGLLKFHSFGLNDPLCALSQTRQARYLRCYLEDLSASVVIEEPSYFDRDYLAEFSAFYGVSSRGYPNRCRRLHFFSDPGISRSVVRKAAAANKRSLERLQESYLGFVILRPIPAAPLGRTVVRWYPDATPETPRVVYPSREYVAHVAGISLRVVGVAWQQQDRGVGACATVGLWSMLHASAFDDHHAIPTTADITRSAHRRASLGARIFPSAGLTIYQVCEAIKEQDLSPVIIEGDITSPGRSIVGMSIERFSSSCAAFIRSGYPILLIGELEGHGDHAMCAVGFRSCAPKPTAGVPVSLQDAATTNLYVHDDNLGPNIRFRISNAAVIDANGEKLFDAKGQAIHRVVLKPDSPSRGRPCPTDQYPNFYPRQLVVAVHNDLRTSPDKLHDTGVRLAESFLSALNSLAARHSVPPFGLTLSTRFIKLAKYLGEELEKTLDGNSKILGKTRLSLCEKAPPMSLHIGVVRIGVDDGTPLVDILYDTTDSDLNHPVFAHVMYNPVIEYVVNAVRSTDKCKFGTAIFACE